MEDDSSLDEARWRVLMRDSPLPEVALVEVVDFLQSEENCLRTNEELLPLGMEIHKLPFLTSTEQQTDTVISTIAMSGAG